MNSSDLFSADMLLDWSFLISTFIVLYIFAINIISTLGFITLSPRFFNICFLILALYAVQGFLYRKGYGAGVRE